MKNRLLVCLLAGAVTVPAAPAASQQVGLAVGYVRTPGRIGDSRSDHGLASRLGLYLGARALVGVGFEIGFDRLNQHVSEFSDQCVLTGGGTGTCFFKRWVRDVGLSLSVIARLQTRVGRTLPYVLAGLGAMTVRTHERSEVTDSNGNHLTNFEFDGTFADDALLGHLGGGVALFPGPGRLAVTVEGRTSALIHNYSGGFQMDVSPSLVVGVRW